MAQSLKKILIITYYWPPASGPGVQRWLKFAKYLPENGWQPIILTVEGGSFPGHDESLLDEVPDGTITYRAKTWEPFALYNSLLGKKGNQVEVGSGAFKSDGSIIKKVANYIRSNYFIPDARVGWKKHAISKAKEIIEKHKIEYVLTTSPPHSAQLIGLALKKSLNIKWIADLRDPWTTILYNQFLLRTKSSEAKDKAYEDAVIKEADQIIVTAASLEREFSDRAKKISTITNGFDNFDFKSKETQSHPFTEFTLFFMGMFTPQQSIPSLWKALNQLNEKYPDFKDSFRLLSIGNTSEAILEDMNQHQISHLLRTEEFQPHGAVIGKMYRSHLLYLPKAKTKEAKLMIHGKTFEYLASKLPILAVGFEDSEVSEILQRCKRKPVIKHENIDEIRSRIESEWLSWKDSKKQRYHDNDLHTTYERSALTQRMAAILDQL